jgi:segregation and condensation protein B
VREVGRDKSAGNAIVYGTSKGFLERFGLKDLAELPPLEQFAPDDVTAAAIRDRLSGVEVVRAEQELVMDADAAELEALAAEGEDDEDEGHVGLVE